MISQSSYERIEFYLHELKAQARPAAPNSDDASGPAADAPTAADASSPVAVQHVEALLALFQENLRELAQPSARSPAKR